MDDAKKIQPDIQTKSVDSVRSPVTTLRTYDPAITHERFLQAVAESFWSTFSKKEGDAMEMKIKMIGQEGVLSDVQDGDEERREFIEKGMKELKVCRSAQETSWFDRILK